jgi:hypothetical protein
MGCPLLVSLTVAAIRRKARKTLKDNLMVPQLESYWRDVNNTFFETAALTQARGAAGITYQLKVRQVFAKSVQFAEDACSEQGLASEAFIMLLRVLRTFPPGRWIPAAAVQVIMNAFASQVAEGAPGSCATEQLLALLEDVGVIMQKRLAVYREDGAYPLSPGSARLARAVLTLALCSGHDVLCCCTLTGNLVSTRWHNRQRAHGAVLKSTIVTWARPARSTFKPATCTFMTCL